ncbi:MAG: L-aspartate oxidase [Nitrospina sp.]|nr:L-aspartate oxidase [Nitrospina sp.]
MRYSHDFIVIGSGIAGLTFALKISEFGNVALIAKDALEEGATRYAQGGIASVMAEDDSMDLHVSDTLEAGRGLCKEDVVRCIIKEGPGHVRDLIDLGARFSRNPDDSYALGREGGHSKRRILHAGDLTGWEIESTLIRAVRARPNIEIFTHHMVVDFITRANLDPGVEPGGAADEVLGLYALSEETGDVHIFTGKATLLGTGGAGKVYLYTSNPDTASGDGVAIAWRAGVKIANMEFFQFHPTCLYHPQAKSFLISEAVRGEGAILRLKNGDTFMEEYHPLGCLAPRDVVARAIDYEMKKRGDDCVYLDITHVEGYRTREHFPNIYKTCKRFGYDMTREPVPVVPAAHYMCGGVVVDLNGQSSLNRLFASGEVCYSGLHGANRLASNSLLEGLVLSHRAAARARDMARPSADLEALQAAIPDWDSGQAVDGDELVIVSHNWDEIRRLMWNYVGIVRTDKRLRRAQRRIDLLMEEINEYYWNFKITRNTLELRNLAIAAQLIIRCALERKESRGLHYNLDYPDLFEGPVQDTVLQEIRQRIINQPQPGDRERKPQTRL